MKKQTRSILQELNSLHDRKDKDLLIESTANNIIQSGANLLTQLRETYDEKTAALLERRFLNCIKSGDATKFTRSIKRIIEDKNSEKKP